MATEAGPAAGSLPEPSDRDLLDIARDALATAYAPYSKFRVGAAVVDENGRVHVGVNVENASYGLTMCAERSAVFAAIAAGAGRIRKVAVAAESQRPVTPCGACRQVLSEFGDAATRVVGEDANRAPIVWSLNELLPHAFRNDHLPGGANGAKRVVD